MKATLTAFLILTLAAPALAQPPAAPAASIRAAARAVALTETAAPAGPPRQRSWIERHPVVAGTIVGASVGATVGAMTCTSPITEGGRWCDSYTDTTGARGMGAAYVGAWGAGIGALVGLAASVFVR